MRYGTLVAMEQKVILGVVGLLIIGAIGIYAISPATQSSSVPSHKYDTLAQCINDSGAKFFGAWWCPHCAAQKALFGDAVKLLPYVECATADGKSQTQVCKDNAITGYPTWVMPDHSTSTGEISLADLALKTNCTLPAE